ncbi:SDR family NAD(P)-dependent oxidoreductase [Anatilimnocola floriformis]|uniref:SDR family NAD(P)-dependent oxidoreductase n=1 Tax=Anatilimnocola floriformis TaxID=2948575 RepID=UPI0020C4378C|nr:SDR family oxidoreductase [Anatilimnocola floriformis]
MFTYQGRTALVTGASSGIGQAFARELARRGMSLILVARDEQALEQLATELRSQHSTKVDVLPTDLSQPAAAERLHQRLVEKQLTVDLLVNNAGFMAYGHFDQIAPTENRAEIMLNTAAVVDLCHALLPDMLARQQGGIINVASIVAFQPVPYMSVYAATKAFVLSFSLALAEELRGRGVQVVTLCPGPTATQFFVRSKSTTAVRVGNRTPDKVAATALGALDRGRVLIVDGWKNTLLTFFSSVLPKTFTAYMAAKEVRPK